MKSHARNVSPIFVLYNVEDVLIFYGPLSFHMYAYNLARIVWQQNGLWFSHKLP